MSTKKKVLIIDGLNNFLRSYVVDPSICSEGSPCGGTKGFMKSLQKLCRETNPHQIIVVWDGAGGSKKRKKMHSEYKEGRTPIKLNRSVHNLSDIEESENKANQFVKLADYLNNMPLIQLMQDNVEADDIIAKLCISEQLRGMIKIIVSSDKDFIQLCDSETILMRPVQKEILNEKRIIEEYGIHPNNFALARSIVGDKSDNLEGVYGVGLPTVSKRFPFLKEQKSYLLTDVINFANEHIGESKVYVDVIDSERKIELNYRMMQLYVPSLSPQASKNIRETLEQFEPVFNKTSIMTKMIKDGFTDFNWDSLFQAFRFIVAEYKRK